MKNNLVLFFLKIVSWIPLRMGRVIGYFFGWLIFKLGLQPTRIAAINIQLCYPHLSRDQRNQLCKARMKNLAQTVFETPRVWRKGNAWVTQKIVSVKGLDLFDKTTGDERGTILIIPHLGNWEVLGLWAGQKKTMTSLYDPPRMLELEHWIKSSREQSGATLVPTNVRGVSALIKALRRGEMTGILPDQHPPSSSGSFASLLGIETRTMTLIHKLIDRSGAKAIMGTALRVTGGWELYFLPVEQGLFSDNELKSLNALNRGIADMIALAPDQYQWEYKRFRETPSGDNKVYD